LALGGKNDLGAPLDNVEMFDPTTNEWSLLPTTMTSKRWGHAACTLSDGRVVVAGGLTEYDPVDTVEVSDSVRKCIVV
jgi:N-acetylneuraminic acid mutarotase